MRLSTAALTVGLLALSAAARAAAPDAPVWLEAVPPDGWSDVSTSESGEMLSFVGDGASAAHLRELPGYRLGVDPEKSLRVMVQRWNERDGTRYVVVSERVQSVESTRGAFIQYVLARESDASVGMVAGIVRVDGVTALLRIVSIAPMRTTREILETLRVTPVPPEKRKPAPRPRLAVQTPHRGGIRALASSGQPFFATAGAEGKVRVWDSATGRLLRTIDPGSYLPEERWAGVSGLAFVAADLLAMDRDGEEILLVDPLSGILRRRIASPPGRKIAGIAAGGGVLAASLVGGGAVLEESYGWRWITDFAGALSAPLETADGLVAVARPGRIEVYSKDELHLQRSVDLAGRSARSVSLDESGRLVAVIDGIVTTFAPDGSVAWKAEVDATVVRTAEDGSGVVAGTKDGSVVGFDHAGVEGFRAKLLDASVSGLAIGSSGLVACTSTRVEGVGPDGRMSLLASTTQHDEALVEVHPDGRAIAWSRGRAGDTSIIDLRSGRLESGLPAIRFAFGPGEIRVGSLPDGKLRFWDGIRERWTVATAAAHVQTIQVAADGTEILVALGNGTLEVRAAKDGALVDSFPLHGDVYHATWTANRRRVVALGGRAGTASIAVWDRDKKAELWRKPFAIGHRLALDAGGERVAAAEATSGEVTVFELDDGEVYGRVPARGYVWRMAFEADGTLLIGTEATGKRGLPFLQGKIGPSGEERRVRWERGGPAVSADERFRFRPTRDRTLEVWSRDGEGEKEERPRCTVAVFDNGEFAVADAEGRFDSSNAGDVEGLHWVIGSEPVRLSQLKERFYDPGLLAKQLGLSKEPLRDVSGFRDVKLYPEVVLAQENGKLDVHLRNRGGGIGRVQVFVNGKELVADARGPGVEPQQPEATLTVDLAAAPRLSAGTTEVRVVVWTADGHLSSRGAVALVHHAPAPAVEPELYAIVVGVSRYASPGLDLRFSAKDAEDFATAVELGAARLFGAKRVHLTLLSSGSDPRARPPTREAVAEAFRKAGAARPEDVLLVYLAGHAISLPGPTGEYLYLTPEARSADPAAFADAAVRARTTLSSEELTEWIKGIPALKQVMVLDTCAAGAAQAKLLEKRAVSGDQVRAIERLKDRTGFHVLMGSAADAVSYEASRYGQGLLTFALLEGMRGAALQGERVDVSRLFQYAADRVPDLARDIGGIQRPIVAAPRGTSFDIGSLGADERSRVPLAAVKPVVLRPQLGNDRNFDVLGLAGRVRARLRDGSIATRGAGHVFVDVAADEFPGGIAPVGRYTVTGTSVKVELWLYRGTAEIAAATVEGTTSELDALAERIAAAVEARLPSE